MTTTKMERVRVRKDYSEKKDGEVFGIVLDTNQLTADFTAGLSVEEVMQAFYALMALLIPTRWFLVRRQDGELTFWTDVSGGGHRTADILMNDDGSFTVERIYEDADVNF